MPEDQEMAAMHKALDRAGVPKQFRRYQEPVIVGRDHDLKWLRFEADMWRRSYEVSEYANAVLRSRLSSVLKNRKGRA